MIERDFIAQKTKEYYIKKYLENKLHGVGISMITLKKIPLGEKIIIHASKPSLIVGSKGSNIRELTKHLKTEFKLENPQIEINEVKDYFLDAQIVSSRIVSSLERFGSARFKSIGHKMLESVINSGALGVEIVISGKIPGARARSWRFYQGYLKKCGDIALTGVRKSKRYALLKTGTIGIKVSIMPSNLVLPDHVVILDDPVQVIEEITEKKEKKKVKGKSKTTKKVKKDKKDKKEGTEKAVVEEKEAVVKEVPESTESTDATESTEEIKEVSEPEENNNQESIPELSDLEKNGEQDSTEESQPKKE